MNHYEGVLTEIKKDIQKHITNISLYHNISLEKLYEADKIIDGFFDFLTNFYKSDNANDKSGKKALVLDFVSNPIDQQVGSMSDLFGSPIEFLMYVALRNSMPESVFEKAYLMPQVELCNGKYVVDIALMDRCDPALENGCEGKPIVGIECDGYKYHYADPDKAAGTAKRIREIEMQEGIKIFQYTGKEIYSNCTQLASQFWEYVCRQVYDLPFEAEQTASEFD